MIVYKTNCSPVSDMFHESWTYMLQHENNMKSASNKCENSMLTMVDNGAK